jgi:hypothetical protein
MTATQLYHDSVRQLPAIERLRLALLILKELTPADLAKSRDPRKDAQPGDDDGSIKLMSGPG